MKPNKKQAIKSKQNNPLFEKRYYAWFALMFLLSIISSTDVMDIYGETRFLFYTIGLSAYALFFYFSTNRKTFIRSKTAQLFFSAGLLFIIWNIISAFTATSYYESFVPLSKILLFGLTVFFIMESMSEKNAIKDSFWFFTFFTFFHALIGILQVGDLAFTGLMHGSDAPYGFTGNRNFIGGLLAACICFPTYTMIKSTGKQKWFPTITVIITFIAIILSETRTAYLALAGLLFLGILGWGTIHGFKNQKALIKPLITGILVFFLSLFSIYLIKPGKLKSVKDRITVITNYSTGTEGAKMSIRHRLKVWEGSINMFKDNPIFGVGPGNWKLDIPLYAKGASPSVDKHKRVMEHPHNVYLLILSELGIFGLLLYLSIIFIILISAFIFIKNRNKNSNTVLFLSLGVVAYLFDGMASLSSVKIEQSFLFAFLFGALLSVINSNKKTEKSISINKKAIIILSTIILIFSFVIAKSNFDFSKASKTVLTQYDQLGAQRVLQIVNENKSSLIKLSPLNYPLELFSARAYLDSKMYDQAIVEINTAIDLNPNNSTLLNTAAMIYMAQGKFKEAMPWLEKGINITPDFFEMKRNLVFVHYNTGECGEALKLLKTMHLEGHQDLKGIRRICLAKVGG